MLVKNWMRAGVEAVGAEASVLQAYGLMKASGLEAVPVQDGTRPVGMITGEDLRSSVEGERLPLDLYGLVNAMEGVKVRDVMNPNPVVVAMDATVEEASALLLENSISSMPVIDAKGGLVGMITLQELFKVMVSLSGWGEGGIQVGLQVDDQRGAVREVYDVLQKHGCRILSIMSTIHTPSGKRHVYVRVCDCEAESVETVVEDLRTVADVLYLADLGKGKRELYHPYTRPTTEWFMG